MKNLNHVLRIQDSLSRLSVARQLIDQAYPELVGNRQECANDVVELYKKLNWLQEQGESAFQKAVEQGRAADAASLSSAETLGDNSRRG